MIWLLMLIFFLIALYLFAIFPRFSKKKELLKYQYVPYAHRGLHNEEYPENSLKAFEPTAHMHYLFLFLCCF